MSSLLTFPAFSPALAPGESREELEALLDAYLDEFDPQSITEEHCVCQLADAEWRLRRLRRAEALSPSPDAQMRRNEDHLVRLYRGALNVILRLRRERRAQQLHQARSVPKPMPALADAHFTQCANQPAM